MCGLVEANLDLCKVPEEETEVVQAEASDFLSRSVTKSPSWDIVFFDPPYANDYNKVLNSLGAQAQKLLNTDGIVIVEHHHKKDLAGKIDELVRTRTLRQGDSALSFYSRETVQ
jgi:16S rRNA G966 N2-methylase RsmD